MKRLKTILNSMINRLRNRSPEVFLALFVAAMAPVLLMSARHLYVVLRGALADTDTFFELLGRNLWEAAAGAVCVVGGIGLIALIIINWNNLWAVARKMILEALNRKVVLILLLFFVILMPSLPFILETEGSLRSQVQIVLTYSLALAEVLLAILAIFICTASVCSEIDKKQVHITDTKPLPRWHFLFGKLMGVCILCGVLLFVMSGAVYGIVNYMARPRTFDGLTAWEARDKEIDLQRVREEVLVARHTAGPVLPDVSRYVDRAVEALRQRGEISRAAEETEARARLRGEAIRGATTAQPYGRVGFTFAGLDPDSRSPLYLRAKPHMTNPDARDADTVCPGIWFFLRAQTTDDGDTRMVVIGEFRQQLTADSFQEIAIDPRVIDPNGMVRVMFQNLRNDTGLYFDPDDGIEVMQKIGGFAPNFYRSVLVVLAHIILLAMLSIMLGATFSFPVASFCVAAVVLLGLLGPWAASHALDLVPLYGDYTTLDFLRHQFRSAMYLVLRSVLAVLPQFGRFSPIERVANGRMVGWGFTARAFAALCFLQGGVAMLLAVYFYWRRELARIIV